MEARKFLYLGLFALLLPSTVICGDASAPKDVTYTKELTDDTFDAAIKSHTYFVTFYAPWCGFCKRLMPIWEQLASRWNTEINPRVVIAKVDCTKFQKTCAKNGVAGYPTIQFFKLGEHNPVRFTGVRDVPTLTEFIEQQLQSDEDNEIVKQVKSTPTSNVVELTEDTYAAHVSTGKHFIKFFAPWCIHCQNLAPIWEELATAFKDTPAVSISKIDCTLYRSICQQFDVKGYPTLLYVEDGRKIEKYSDARTLEALKAYVETKLGSEAKEEPVALREAPVDSKQYVIILTAENFQSTVKDGVVFVKFYAPWCGHCQKLNPTWDQLAERMHELQNGVKIAKVDCTTAENKKLCSEEQINGYPTLHAFKNGEKQSEYFGSRSLPELVLYISRFVERDEL